MNGNTIIRLSISGREAFQKNLTRLFNEVIDFQVAKTHYSPCQMKARKGN